MRSVSVVTFLALASALQFGCGGGGGGNGPTAPTVRKQATVVLGIASIGGNSLQEGQLLWAGAVVDSLNGNPRSSYALTHTAQNVASGRHEFTFRVVRQVRSPSTYSLDPTIAINSPGTETVLISLPREQVSIRTGDSKSWTVNIP